MRTARHLPRIVPVILASTVVASSLAGIAAVRAGATAASAPDDSLATAVYDVAALNGGSALEFQRAHDSGATYVRIYVDLGTVVGGGTSRPAHFDVLNPDDPNYSWSATDAAVTAAATAGLEPILDLDDTPPWARDASQPGRYMPSAQWFGRFAQAAAKRYSGSFDGLPRVRYWEAWNEPNIELYLSPSWKNGIPFAADWYRSMVNAFAAGVKRVDPSNQVIAGALAPYAALTGPGIPPLTFTRAFFCMDRIRVRPRPQCIGRPAFDIWSMHPYTWGGPTHHATVTGDLALADMLAMDTVLQQAWSAGRIVASQQPKFWVTEFSWNTSPPNPGGVPLALQTRWTAQALYTMWQSGVSLVTWFQLRDTTASASSGPGNSGLYFNGGGGYATDSPKSTLEAFRFPTVAFGDPGGIKVWARTPTSSSGSVEFQQDVGTGWNTIGSLTADANGIVQGILPGTPLGSVRAVYVPTGETSVAFDLADVPDQPVNPFG